MEDILQSERRLDHLIQLSDLLLVEMMTYDKALNNIIILQSKVRTMCRSFRTHRDPGMIVARISTIKNVLEMFDQYRINKWEDIHVIADEIREIATELGFEEYQRLVLEDRNAVTMSTTNTDLLTKYHIKKDARHSRPN